MNRAVQFLSQPGQKLYGHFGPRGHESSSSDRGRSPSAARRQAKAFRKTPPLGGKLTRCEPGRFVVGFMGSESAQSCPATECGLYGSSSVASSSADSLMVNAARASSR